MHTSCVKAQTALAFLQIFWCWREKKARTYFLAAKPSLKSDRSHSQICMPCCSLLRAVQVGVPAAGRKRSTSGFTPICVSSQHEEPGRQAGSRGKSWAVPQAGESLSSGATCLQSQTPSREGQSQSAGHSLSKCCQMRAAGGGLWSAEQEMIWFLKYFCLEDFLIGPCEGLMCWPWMQLSSQFTSHICTVAMGNPFGAHVCACTQGWACFPRDGGRLHFLCPFYTTACNVCV